VWSYVVSWCCVVSDGLVWSCVVLWCLGVVWGGLGGLGWSGAVPGYCEVQSINDHRRTSFQEPKTQFSYYLERCLVWFCVVSVVLCGLGWFCVVSVWSRCGLGWSGAVPGYCEVQSINDHRRTSFQEPKTQFSYYLERCLVWFCVVLCGLRWSCVVWGGFAWSRCGLGVVSVWSGVVWCGSWLF
jgi:hypothetical protein